MFFLYIKNVRKNDVYTSIPKNANFYTKNELFLKNKDWLRLQLLNCLIYNCSFAKVNTGIHIHNWREKDEYTCNVRLF
ncbi:hypothetical protein COJ50_13855 [Bacillus cereus]|uniref:Uncharacterized protein n=1 Tax=Bacillus cereus TaxID=1396 RepID=A0A2A8R712_BACCE|nr:hypothetical protein CN450_17655 [Bacillus cereus]PFN24784.1 hypothetical protein COJ50_13855 [Bacillus cereus]